MAKLELPVRAFIDNFFRRLHPDRDWSRGSAIRELLLSPMSSALQPFRHEIDVVKINQSIKNYPYMRRSDLDALAANMGKFRQTGGQSTGNVRMYFDRAADYEFNYLEFVAVDNTVFILQAPVRITATELLANRRSDNTFTADVAVRSVGVGNRYALAAGSIVAVRNAPPSVLRVENPEDFQVTAPNESNYDVINGLFKNMGLKNLVGKASIRAPLLDNFPGILSLFVTGATHSKMLRDVVVTEIDGNDVELHVGGTVDVWVNTNSPVKREVIMSYLPSSKELRIVSAEQAQNASLLYPFARLYLSAEGEYAASDSNDVNLDESTIIYLDQAGVPVEGAVISQRIDDRYRLSSKDIINGDSMISLPVSGNNTGVGEILLVDPIGADLSNTPAAPGQTLRLGDDYYRVLKLDGKVIAAAPTFDTIAPVTFDDLGGSVVVAAGDRFIPSTIASATVKLNDRMSITRGGAQGQYRVLAIDGTGLWVGRVRAQVQITYESDDGTDYTYEVESPTGGVPQIPADIDGTHWLFVGADDGAYDQTPGDWLKIKSVTRTSTKLTITTIGGPGSGTTAATVVGGLRDALTGTVSLFFDRPTGADFSQSLSQDFAVGHTLYTNVTALDLVAGSTQMDVLGLGLVVQCGDVLLFDSPPAIDEALRASTGGDGSKFSLLVREVLTPDRIRVSPPLPVALAAGSRFNVLRNQTPLGSATATTVSGNQIGIPAWPLGLGDGMGMGIRYLSTLVSGSLVSGVAIGTGATLITFTSGVSAALANARVDDEIVISGGSPIDGTYPILGIDATGQTVTIPGTHVGGPWSPGVTLAVVRGKRLDCVQASTAGDTRTLKFKPPRQSRIITMSVTDYVSPSPSDIGGAVRQTISGTTYAGVLASFDNVAMTWTVVPNNPAVDLFGNWTGAGEEITLLSSAATARPTAVAALVPIDYFSPQGGDVGLLVRQGTYTGLLVSYVNSPTYEWKVKPLSEFDLFDGVDVLTFVDRLGTGEPVTPAVGNAAQGALRVPATAPEVNAGSVTLSLSASPGFAPGATVEIMSRWGRAGGFFDGKRFRVFGDGVINSAPFAGITPADTQLLILGGINRDTYRLDSAATYALNLLSGAPTDDFLRIANAPGPQQLTVGAPVPQGSTVLNVPGSRLGLWGHAGRVMLLSAAGTEYRIVLAGPSGADGVNLLDPLPVTLFPTQAVTVEIVEAFHLPFFLVDDAAFKPYRLFETPDVGNVLMTGTAGVHNNSLGTADRFFDASVNFRALLGFSDVSPVAQDLLLYIDSGPDASVTGKAIIGLADDNTLLLNEDFDHTSTAVSYHILRKNRAMELEDWFYAEITDNDELRLLVDASFDFSRFSTYRGWQVTVRPSPGRATVDHATAFNIPVMTIRSFDVGTRTITLDIDNVAAYTLVNVFNTAGSPAGFQPAILRRRVRVSFQSTDRIVASSISGSAVSTFNYYSNGFFTLPVVKIQEVALLDTESLQPLRQLPFALQVNDKGLRYGSHEDNTLLITEPGSDVLFKPIRVTYVTDPSIATIDAYLTNDETRVLGGYAMAKRMETISIDVAVEVRSEKSEAELRNAVATYINTLSSTQRLSKDGIIKHLYQLQLVSFVNTDSLVLNGIYYQMTGEEVEYEDVSDVFGADTAAYLANVVSVTKLTDA